jgi:hypothetical protein
MKHLAAIAAFAAALLGSHAALAQGRLSNVYAGGALGQSDVDSRFASSAIDSGTVDGKDTAFKIFAGIQLHPNIAGELSYVDLGTVKYRGTFAGAPASGGIDLKGAALAAVGSWPFSEYFSVHARAGVWTWEAEASDSSGGLPAGVTSDGTDLFYGIGATLNITRKIGLRAEWEQYKIESDKASLISLGVLYRF